MPCVKELRGDRSRRLLVGDQMYDEISGDSDRSSREDAYRRTDRSCVEYEDQMPLIPEVNHICASTIAIPSKKYLTSPPSPPLVHLSSHPF